LNCVIIGFLTLSKNDAIQQRAAQTTRLTLLIEMTEQYPITLDILWSLSFNADIQHELRTYRTFMNKLTQLKNDCHDKKIRKIIFGILWNLESIREDRPTSDIDDRFLFDIMISYSHKDQTICKRIYEQLIQAGYRVWIDFDQMHGNVMDAMAQAIERSQMIIICMSEQYRRSNYCRAEAHYAFQRQLKLVPILLQEHYQPDGWLLFLIGQLLYVDFVKHTFDEAINLLIDELQAPVNQIMPIKSIESTRKDRHETLPSSVIHTLPENILQWTSSDVHHWLMASNLTQMASLLKDFDGASLNSLNDFFVNVDSNQILNLFQSDCQKRINERISLLELARFRSLLRQQLQLKVSIIDTHSRRQHAHCHLI
jgi:hypothetical protein